MATKNTEAQPDEFLTDAQLQRLLKVSWRTTQRWRTEGGGPPFVRISERRLIYSRRDVDEWLRSRTHAHRAAEAAA